MRRIEKEFINLPANQTNNNILLIIEKLITFNVLIYKIFHQISKRSSSSVLEFYEILVSYNYDTFK